MSRTSFLPASFLSAAAAVLLLGDAALSAPTIRNVSLRAIQVGATTTLTIDGAELLPNPRVVLPVPVAKQEVKPDGSANRVQIDVTLAADVPPGIYHLRLASDEGISAPVPVAVDGLPQAAFADEIGKQPVALHGTLTGGTTLETSFQGGAGQRVVIEVEARRLGSPLRPVLHLYDQERLQIAWCQPKQTLFGDARMDVTLPSDGRYTIALHDAQYSGPGPGHFRLKVGALPYVDSAYPLGVQRGQPATVSFIGNVPADATAQLTPTALTSEVPAPWPQVGLVSGLRPRLIAGDGPEIVEPASGEAPEAKALPVGLNGRLAQAGEEDRFRLQVEPGAKLRFEVTANRIGSPLDGVLRILNADGGQIARNDDGPGTIDPVLDFTVPGNVKQVLVAVSDLHDRGGENFVYRVGVRPAGDAPTFDLELLTTPINVPASGPTIVRVRANRRGYNGAIRLAFDGLPQGVQVAADTIPAGATDTLLTLTGSGSPAAMLTSLGGQSEDGKLTRPATTGAAPLAELQPWTATEVALAVRSAEPLEVAWGEPAEQTLWQGTKVAVPVKVTRGEGATGPVRLSLVTSQIPPKNKQNKPDPARTLRAEKAVEVPADQGQGSVDVLVPYDLKNLPYDLAVKAELLSEDKKNVLATAYTPSVRLPAKSSLELALAGEPAVEAVAGEGPTGKLSGTIARRGGLSGPVTVSLAGLPKGVESPEVKVAPEASEFTLEVRFKKGTKPQPLEGVKAVATLIPNEKQPEQAIRSNQVPVQVKVVAAEGDAGK